MYNKLELDEKVVAINVSIDNRKELLNFMSKQLEKEGYVKESFINAIAEREEIFSTGIPTKHCGIAIPHTDSIHVNKAMISVVVLKETVEFLEMGDPEEIVNVKIVFMLAMKDGKAQVELLTNLMGIVQDEVLLEKICESSKEEVMVLLNERLGEFVKGENENEEI